MLVMLLMALPSASLPDHAMRYVVTAMRRASDTAARMSSEAQGDVSVVTHKA